MSKKKLMVIGPQFFSYTDAITAEIIKRGFFCSVFNQLHSDNIFTKIIYRLNLSFIFKNKVQAHRDNIYKFIGVNKITDVFFISPDIVDAEFLVEIKKHAKVHLYMWDGFGNKKNALAVLSLFDTKASFDMFDCKNHNMQYIPLFALVSYRASDAGKIYDLSFCGTVHSNRPSWIEMLVKYSNKNNFKLGLLLYYYSPILLFIRLLKNRGSFSLYNKVSFSSFPKEDIAKMFGMSKAVVDITHPDQSGLTSRTFEALRSGSKLVTNNKNCQLLADEYHSRIFIIDDVDSKKTGLLEFINSEVEPLNKNQDYFLSIERFIDQILKVLHD